MLTAALSLPKDGAPVFPCAADATPYTAHGFLDATTDPEIIRKIWKRWPDALLALPTGSVSGTLVLDIDKKNGKDGESSLSALEDKHGTLPATLEVLTPSGGRHLYFNHPDCETQCSTDKLGIGLDIRADGGYVIAPPSHRNGGTYEWEASNPEEFAEPPPWLVDAARKITSKKMPTSSNTSRIGSIHHFLLWRRNDQNSAIRPGCGCATRRSNSDA